MARRANRSDYEKLSKPELIERLVGLEKHRSESRLKATRPVRSEEERGDALPAFAELFEHAPLACCVLDRDGAVIEANAAAGALLGVERRELIGAPLACESSGDLARHLARCFGGERRVTSELRFVALGREVLIDAISAPVIRSDSVVSCITILDDVTPGKRAELRAQVRARDVRLATVAHDLAQPLGIILGYSSAARSPEALDKLAQRLQTIRRLAERMNRMLRDLLDLSSIEAGRLPLAFRSVDMAAIVREVVESFIVAAQAKRITLRVTTGDAPLRAVADGDRIAQALGNLLDNAVKFTPERGEIHVTAQARARRIRVAVTDNGPGIPSELVARLFEPYTRAPETAPDGYGLGLAIAKGIITASHGAIGVESKVGEGSTFFFTLPGH